MFNSKSNYRSEMLSEFKSNYFGINFWTVVYVGMVLIFSIFQVQFNFALFILYFALAIPFLYHIEYYLSITLLLSTISYYFVGAGGGLLSMSTILLILIVIRVFLFDNGKVLYDKINCWVIVALCVLATVSYIYSPFGYTNGWLGLIYVLVLSLIIGNYVQLDLEKLVNSLFVVAYTLLAGYFITVAVSGMFVDGRLTIANEVNTNTFGKSCAQLATIFAVGAIIYKNNRIINIISCVAISILSVLTGSRGSLIAFVLATILISVIYAYRNQVLSGTIFRIIVIAVVLVFLLGAISSTMDIDFSRFGIGNMMESRRRLIYQTVPSYVIDNNFWLFGYGPGHDCSRQVVRSLVLWDFSNTHNTFLEAFGELGIIGTILTFVCTFTSLRNIRRVSAVSKDGYVLFALLVCLLINSLAESFFCNYLFWCLLAICRQRFDVVPSN